jgi:hypothetical protein
MDHHVPRAITNGYDSAEWTYLRLMRTARANFRIQPYWTVRQNSIECCLRRMMICLSWAAPAAKVIVLWCDLYTHQLRVSIGGCIHDLELVARAGELEDMAEEVLFLPL